MSSQRVKHHKNIPQIYQTVKFSLSFYNDPRCNKINQMAALRMDWHSWSWIMNIWNYILTRVWLQFQNFKCSLLTLQRFSKSLKIWKSEFDLANFTGTSYHWYHLTTNVNDTVGSNWKFPFLSWKDISTLNYQLLEHLKYPIVGDYRILSTHG